MTVSKQTGSMSNESVTNHSTSMEFLSMIETWKLAATICTIVGISLISFLANYWLTKRRSCRILDGEEEEEVDTRTPEELFEDKLLNEEYEAALEIARIHGLNSDLVYQKQWNNADVTIESIDEFLAKVTDSQWVLSECLERIPQDLASNKYLLDFGIGLTDSIVNVNEVEDICQISSSQEDAVMHRKEAVMYRKEAVMYRKRLLEFRDRLGTFEHILGGKAASSFNCNLYEKFRRQEVFESGLEFAREGDHRALGKLFTFHGIQSLEHWLPLLSQIPEVVPPFDYRHLLPECGLSENEEDVYPWEEVKIREEDWCEKMIPDPPEESPEIFYSLHPHLIEYRGRQLTKSLISKWFSSRARQIEQCTCLVSNSLELVQLGIQRNLPDLNGLHSRLETFSTLIYDCLPRAEDQNQVNLTCDRLPGTEDQDQVTLTFERFSKLSSDQIVRLLMSGCKKDPATFMKCLRESLLPYLTKYDPRYSDGRCQGSLENFLVECARESLHLVRAVFEQSAVTDTSSVQHFASEDGSHCIGTSSVQGFASKDGSNCIDASNVRIITNVKDLLNLASRCINECTDENFLTDAFAIIECLPQRSDSDPAEIKPLQDEIDQLENNLVVIELLEKNGCKILMSQLKSIQKNGKDVHRLFTEMIRKGSKRNGFNIFDQTHWNTLLTEALQARADCFSSTITQAQIHEIFIKTLLSFGREQHFDLAYNLMQSMDASDLERFMLDCSRDYVNSAASTGDKTIALAKKCLHLLPKETQNNNPHVKEELDLITALEIIHEFWTLTLLPVQIRLMDQPRIQLIHHLLQSNKIYRQIPRVLQVSKLLRIGANFNDEKDAESMVLITLGEAALDDADFKSCWNVCEIIMDREYSHGWKLCLNLALNFASFGKNGAKSSDFGKNGAKFGPNISDLSFADFGKNVGDLKQRMDLLSFALTNCEDSDGRRMNQILEVIESTREEEEREISSQMKGGSFDLLTGVVSEELFAKTASHLTTWLIPKFKLNLTTNERSKDHAKINYGDANISKSGKTDEDVSRSDVINEDISRSEVINEDVSGSGETDERIETKVDNISANESIQLFKVENELIKDQLAEDGAIKGEVIDESIKDYDELIKSMTTENDEVDQVESKREETRQELTEGRKKKKEEIGRGKKREEGKKEELRGEKKKEVGKEEKAQCGWEEEVEELTNESGWDHDEDPGVGDDYKEKVVEAESVSLSIQPKVSDSGKVEILDKKLTESASGWDFDEPDLESEEQSEPKLVSEPTLILLSEPNPVLLSEPAPILVSEQAKNEKEATGSVSGWDIDEDLELEESAESFPEATPVTESQEDHGEQKLKSQERNEEQTLESQDRCEKQKRESASGWDIDEDLDPDLDLEETTAESELVRKLEHESKSESTPNSEFGLGRTSVLVSNVTMRKEEAKKESESGWDIEDELDLELSDEVVSNPVLESPEGKEVEPQGIEVSEKREEKKKSVHSGSASGWDFDDEDLQLDENLQLDDEESGWTHDE